MCASRQPSYGVASVQFAPPCNNPRTFDVLVAGAATGAAGAAAGAAAGSAAGATAGAGAGTTAGAGASGRGARGASAAEAAVTFRPAAGGLRASAEPQQRRALQPPRAAAAAAAPASAPVTPRCAAASMAHSLSGRQAAQIKMRMRGKGEGDCSGCFASARARHARCWRGGRARRGKAKVSEVATSPEETRTVYKAVVVSCARGRRGGLMCSAGSRLVVRRARASSRVCVARPHGGLAPKGGSPGTIGHLSVSRDYSTLHVAHVGAGPTPGVRACERE